MKPPLYAGASRMATPPLIAWHSSVNRLRISVIYKTGRNPLHAWRQAVMHLVAAGQQWAMHPLYALVVPMAMHRNIVGTHYLARHQVPRAWVTIWKLVCAARQVVRHPWLDAACRHGLRRHAMLQQQCQPRGPLRLLATSKSSHSSGSHQCQARRCGLPGR